MCNERLHVSLTHKQSHVPKWSRLASLDHYHTHAHFCCSGPTDTIKQVEANKNMFRLRTELVHFLPSKLDPRSSPLLWFACPTEPSVHWRLCLTLLIFELCFEILGEWACIKKKKERKEDNEHAYKTFEAIVELGMFLLLNYKKMYFWRHFFSDNKKFCDWKYVFGNKNSMLSPKIKKRPIFWRHNIIL